MTTVDAFRLGQTVTRLRKHAGLTQQQLAAEVGYRDQSGIATVETGKNLPSLPKAVALADALGVTLDDLLKEAR